MKNSATHAQGQHNVAWTANAFVSTDCLHWILLLKFRIIGFPGLRDGVLAALSAYSPSHPDLPISSKTYLLFPFISFSREERESEEEENAKSTKIALS